MYRLHTYREVEKLPERALSVNEYSVKRGCTSQHVYKLWRLHKGDGRDVGFEIVVFHEHNYIIPKIERT